MILPGIYKAAPTGFPPAAAGSRFALPTTPETVYSPTPAGRLFFKNLLHITLPLSNQSFVDFHILRRYITKVLCDIKYFPHDSFQSYLSCLNLFYCYYDDNIQHCIRLILKLIQIYYYCRLIIKIMLHLCSFQIYVSLSLLCLVNSSWLIVNSNSSWQQ